MDRKGDLNKIMNRLRARLYSQIEALGLGKEREEAVKQGIKDNTSFAWNDITELLNES